MGERLRLDAAASMRQGLTAFIHESDDRVHVDVDGGLFLAADALGPRYGGYHAPLGVDVALRIIAERLKVRPSGSIDHAEQETRAAFAEAVAKSTHMRISTRRSPRFVSPTGSPPLPKSARAGRTG